MKSAKEIFFITDRRPRPETWPRQQIAQNLRARRRDPAFRVWREDGEIRCMTVACPTVIQTFRNREA